MLFMDVHTPGPLDHGGIGKCCDVYDRRLGSGFIGVGLSRWLLLVTHYSRYAFPAFKRPSSSAALFGLFFDFLVGGFGASRSSLVYTRVETGEGILLIVSLIAPVCILDRFGCRVLTRDIWTGREPWRGCAFILERKILLSKLSDSPTSFH